MSNNIIKFPNSGIDGQRPVLQKLLAIVSSIKKLCSSHTHFSPEARAILYTHSLKIQKIRDAIVIGVVSILFSSIPSSQEKVRQEDREKYPIRLILNIPDNPWQSLINLIEGGPIEEISFLRDYMNSIDKASYKIYRTREDDKFIIHFLDTHRILYIQVLSGECKILSQADKL